MIAIIAASAAGSIVLLIIVPVLVAALTAAATMLVTRVGEATNRRRDRYAEAVRTLVAWVEYPYRVRRRTDDTPHTLTALASLGHDLQERLACHQAWIATERPDLARAYAQARASINEIVGPAIKEAWTSDPVTTPTGMNLNGWGPSAECTEVVANIQHAVEDRFGLRRLTSGRSRRKIR